MKRRRNNRKLVFLLSVILIVAIIGLIIIGTKKNINSDEVNGYTIEEQIQDENALVIETKFGNLYYPEKWEEYLRTEIREDDLYIVEFYGCIDGKDEQHIFEIVFGESDGMLLGQLEADGEKVDVYLVANDFEFTGAWTDEDINIICSMQEDMNYLIGMLEKQEGFVANK